ncbi:MAG: hypothetical protein J6S18_00425 [Oscillospiraceae bacterium]|nr:hypothetical protein [Oscillospiraceae bacterium]
MKTRYYTSREEALFFVNRPDGTVVCVQYTASGAQNICDELNKALHMFPATETYSVQEEAEHQEKPKKKRIPRVLRPTITMPEGDWCTVFAAVYAHAKNKLNQLAAEGAPDTEYLLGELEEIKKLVRVSDYIKREVKFSCDAIRNPIDEETPF